MTLIEISLHITGCKDITELSSAPQEMRKKLFTALEKVSAERVPLKHWNELSEAFGLPARETAEESREVLLLELSSTVAEDTLSEESADSEQTAEQEKCEHSAQSVSDEDTSAEVISSEGEMPKEQTPQPKIPSKTLSVFLRVWNIVTTVMVAVVVVLAVLLAGVRIFGLQVFSVLSGSMEPEYHVGSLIYVKTVDYTALAVGDDITFMLDEETVATHRIVEILPDENDPIVLRFRTQGIANDEVDGTPVHYKNVIGKPVFTIPKLGYVASYIQNPPGTYIAISIGAIILFLVFLPDLLTPEDEPKKGKKDKPKKQKQPQEPDNNEG